MKLGARIGVPYGAGEKPTVYTADVSDFTIQGNTAAVTASTVTGNGHIGNAKRIVFLNTGTGVSGLTYDLPVEIVSAAGVGKKVRISFLYRYKETGGQTLSLGNGAGATTNFTGLSPTNDDDAARYIKEDIWTYSNPVNYSSLIQRQRFTIMWVNADTEFLEISDLSIAVY